MDLRLSPPDRSLALQGCCQVADVLLRSLRLGFVLGLSAGQCRRLEQRRLLFEIEESGPAGRWRLPVELPECGVVIHTATFVVDIHRKDTDLMTGH